MGFRIRPTVLTYSAGVTPQALDFPTGISFNSGTDYWRIKWKGKLHETRTGLFGVFGNNNTSSSSGFAFNFTNSGDGLFNLNRGGSLVFASPAGFIKRDATKDYIYEVEHLADGTLIYRRDEVEPVARGSNTASNAFNTATTMLNSLYRRVAIPTTGVLDLELEYFEFQFQNNPTVRYSGADLISPGNKLLKVGGDGSDDLVQTSTWPTDDNEWIYYDSGTAQPVKTGTFTASAIAGASMPGTKIALGTYAATGVISAAVSGNKFASGAFAAGATVAASVAGTKIASATFGAAANVFFGIAATTKIAKGSFAATAIASATLQGGNNLTVGGTFTASAIAGASMPGSKVVFGTFAASAVATASATGSKRAGGTFNSLANAGVAASGSKIANATFAATAHVRATMTGYNASIQMPVTEWTIFTNSQPAFELLTTSEPSATLVTLSQQEFSIQTNS